MMTENNNQNEFDAERAAETIIDNEFDKEDDYRGCHPEDVRAAFRAVAAKITQGKEPTDYLASETDDYWLALYAPGQTNYVDQVIREGIPDERDDYPHPRDEEYIRILGKIVRSISSQAHPQNVDAPGRDQFTLIHVKPVAYGSNK